MFSSSTATGRDVKETVLECAEGRAPKPESVVADSIADAGEQSKRELGNYGGSEGRRESWCADMEDPFRTVPQTWLFGLSPTVSRVGIVDLHPDIFAVSPRLDILHQNIRWQCNYRNLVIL